MSSLVRLFSPDGKEIPKIDDAGRLTGYEPYMFDFWIPRWCECGRPEIKFEPSGQSVEFKAKNHWPKEVSHFSIDVNDVQLMKEPFSDRSSIRMDNGAILKLSPHLEVPVSIIRYRI